MAPNRGSSKSSRGGRGGSRGASRGGKDAGSRHGATSRSRVEKKTKLPPPKQQKTKSAAGKLKHGSEKKRPRVYTDKELGIPKLNMITPVGVAEPRGKRRGKIFVDDAVSLYSSIEMSNIDLRKQRSIRGWTFEPHN
jgi:60S ribosomal subunit assembly/export protein LOC1